MRNQLEQTGEKLQQILPSVRPEIMEGIRASVRDSMGILYDPSRKTLNPPVKYFNNLKREIEAWCGPAILQAITQVSKQFADYFRPAGQKSYVDRDRIFLERAMLYTYRALVAQIEARLHLGEKPPLNQDLPVALAAEVSQRLFDQHDFDSFRAEVQAMLQADGNGNLPTSLMQTLQIDLESARALNMDIYGLGIASRHFEEERWQEFYAKRERDFTDACFIMYYLLREQIRRSQ